MRVVCPSTPFSWGAAGGEQPPKNAAKLFPLPSNGMKEGGVSSKVVGSRALVLSPVAPAPRALMQEPHISLLELSQLQKHIHPISEIEGQSRGQRISPDADGEGSDQPGTYKQPLNEPQQEVLPHV